MKIYNCKKTSWVYELNINCYQLFEKKILLNSAFLYMKFCNITGHKTLIIKPVSLFNFVFLCGNKGPKGWSTLYQKVRKIVQEVRHLHAEDSSLIPGTTWFLGYHQGSFLSTDLGGTLSSLRSHPNQLSINANKNKNKAELNVSTHHFCILIVCISMSYSANNSMLFFFKKMRV